MSLDTTVDVLRWQFDVVHRLLDGQSGPVNYARNVVLEDLTVNSVLAGCAPLALSTWRGRTGLSRLPPIGECLGARWPSWVRSVEINLAELRLYAHAVHVATDAYLTSAAVAPDRLAVCVLSALLLSQVRGGVSMVDVGSMDN